MSCPKYTVPDYESSCISFAPRIKFHQNVLFSTCSIHGLIGEGRLWCNLYELEKIKDKIRSRKMLTLKELVIGNFMNDVYLTSLEKYIYHVHDVVSLNPVPNTKYWLTTMNKGDRDITVPLKKV